MDFRARKEPPQSEATIAKTNETKQEKVQPAINNETEVKKSSDSDRAPAPVQSIDDVINTRFKPTPGVAALLEDERKKR